MLRFLAHATLLSFRAPRHGVRLILDNVQGAQGAAILFGLALVALCLMISLEWLFVGPPDMSRLPEGTPLPNMAQAVQGAALMSVIAFAVLTLFVFGVGRLFGGQGELTDVAVALAWHSLITAVFAPFVSVSQMMAEGGPAFWRIGLMLFTSWMLICFIAEAHRFASAWRVGGVMAGVMFALSVFSLFLLRGAA